MPPQSTHNHAATTQSESRRTGFNSRRIAVLATTKGHRYETKNAIVAAILVLIGGWCGFNAIAQPSHDQAQDKVTPEVASAAKKFLATLDDAQRGKVLFDFNDEAQRKRWSNLPSGAFQRAGLRMGDLTPQQREAALAVLAAALSKQGYEKILQIVEADETLRATGGRGRGGPGGRGEVVTWRKWSGWRWSARAWRARRRGQLWTR